MPIGKDDVKLVEDWVIRRWDEHVQFIVEAARLDQRPDAAELRRRRELVEEARAALKEVRNRSESKP